MVGFFKQTIHGFLFNDRGRSFDSCTQIDPTMKDHAYEVYD